MAMKPKSALAGHTAGIFADMTLDGPEIGTLVIVVDRAKNLPNRKTMGKQDPYCAMRLGKEAKKTETDRRGGQTPKWDQELRFTVHESPDYYRLKVSCFNDDKKTDLIGDTFIDLTDLIKPGGGSNDLWHQLSYKGKYAGDIRMEMTYYDTRPRESRPPMKKKTRDGNPSIAEDQGDASSMAPGPRQLGPREIRRRPLPSSPGQTLPPTVSNPLPAQQQHQHQQSFETEQHRGPAMTYQGAESESFLGQHRQPATSTSYHPTPQYSGLNRPPNQAPQRPPKVPLAEPVPQYMPISMAEQPLTDVIRNNHRRSSQNPSAPYDQLTTSYYETAESRDHENAQLSVQQRRASGQALRPLPIEPSQPFSDQSDFNNAASRRIIRPHISQDSHMIRDEETYAQNFDSSMYMSGRHDYYQTMDSESPVTHSNHEESFSGQTIDSHGIPPTLVEEPSNYDAPPPPPKHQPASHRPQPDYPPSSYVNQPLRPIPRRPTIEERSPLQNIEKQYEPFAQSEHSVPRQPSFREDHSVSSPNDNFTPDYQLVRASYIPQFDSNKRHSYYDSQQRQPQQQQAAGHFHRRSSYNDAIEDSHRHRLQSAHVSEGTHHEYRTPNVASAMDNDYSARPMNYSQPEDVDSQYFDSRQPRQGSSANSKAFTRKAVSPGPYPVQSGRRLSSTPYSPDAYDVLNPASSPVTNENTAFETPEQARESARLRESERSRELGPIIGNDGREIDPSDHLPSDTWAPEPERKQRRPEHVIHFRTKNASRANVTPTSSPASQRMSMPRSSPISPRTNPPSSTPASGRNKLQKAMPSRPVASQTYQKPYVESGPSNEMPNRPSYQRNSSYETSPTSHRSPLSEYQVPAGNSYTPRSSMYNSHSSTPPKMPIVSGSHGQTYDDPLAAEMSMIDIGPSRGVRTLVRSNRAY